MKSPVNVSFKTSSPSFTDREEHEGLTTEPRKYWEVNAHCETLQFPQPWPEILFDKPSTNYHYQQLAASGTPSQRMSKLLTQAHYHVLARLNRSKLQVRNFILPVQLIKMKHMDPLTRQKIIEELCKYLSLQENLCNIVLEQAELKFQQLCCLLVAIANCPRVKSLYLWHALDSCDKPFEGPLQSETVLDDLPRIPYTYNPGGRKYLKDLKENAKGDISRDVSHHKRLTVKSIISQSEHSDSSRKHSFERDTRDRKDSTDLAYQLKKLESFVITCFEDDSGNAACERIKKKFIHTVQTKSVDHVKSQKEVGIQCTISQDLEEELIEERTFTEDVSHSTHHLMVDQSRSNHLNTKNEIRNENESTLETVLEGTRLEFCKNYLKYYEHTKISPIALQEIYMIALSTLTHLTDLAVNYCMLADGTGKALLAIGSIAKGKLKDLKLLCEPSDTPSPTHRLYEEGALQAIPDLTWRKVKQDCPDLRVHIICVSMSAYSVTKHFVTKHMPLNTFQMENGFCPNIVSPQLNIYSTLKCLWLNYTQILEHVDLILWHTTGRIDSSLEKLIQKCQLVSFAYHGPLQFKTTVNELCDAALSSPKMECFKLMVQGDPCFPHIAKELSSSLYNDYRQRFHDKAIEFELGTFSS